MASHTLHQQVWEGWIHWRRNPTNADDTVSFRVVGSHQIVTIWMGTKDRHSPLSCLEGCKDAILHHILSYTEFAVVPCSCCKALPVVYCCRRRRLVIADRSRKTADEMAWLSGQVPESIPKKGGEVPESILLASDDDNKILISAENISPWGWSGSGKINGDWMSSKCCYSRPTYLAITNHGLYSGILDLPWHESASYRVFAHPPLPSNCLSIERKEWSEDRTSYSFKGYSFRLRHPPRLVEYIVKICQRQQHKALSSGTEDNS
jgi:hypothetical protein